MAQTYLPRVRNWNTGMSRRDIEVFNPQAWQSRLRRDIGRSYVVKKVQWSFPGCLFSENRPENSLSSSNRKLSIVSTQSVSGYYQKSRAWLLSNYPCHASLWFSCRTILFKILNNVSLLNLLKQKNEVTAF